MRQPRFPGTQGSPIAAKLIDIGSVGQPTEGSTANCSFDSDHERGHVTVRHDEFGTTDSAPRSEPLLDCSTPGFGALDERTNPMALDFGFVPDGARRDLTPAFEFGRRRVRQVRVHGRRSNDQVEQGSVCLV